MLYKILKLMFILPNLNFTFLLEKIVSIFIMIHILVSEDILMELLEKR